MSGGFSNKPKILKGAFVEYGLSIPPLFVVFQFNPEKLTRKRTLTFSVPGWRQKQELQTISLRQFHNEQDSLLDIRDSQQVSLAEEDISFDIRLDATDELNDGDTVTENFGIAHRLAALELMVHPKEESMMGAAVGALLGTSQGFSFTGRDNPPMVLFAWGRKRVLPVNITSMNVTETEFSTDLNPVRATVSVSLTVIEGPNPPYTYTKVMKEVMAALNMVNIADIAHVVIP